MKKERIASVRIILIILLTGTLLFTFGLIAYFKIIFDIGAITDIGVENGFYIMLSICIQVIGVFVSTAGMNKRSHPVNRLYYKKYIIINVIQFILFIGINLIVMKEQFEAFTKTACMIFIAIGSIIILFLHWCIMKNYQCLSDEDFNKMVESYLNESNNSLETNENMDKMKHFIVYLILIGVFSKYILFHPITMIIFVVINIVYYYKYMNDILKNKRMLMQLVLVVVGLIVVNIFPAFQQRTYDEKGMVLILFYVPTIYWITKKRNKNGNNLIWMR